MVQVGMVQVGMVQCAAWGGQQAPCRAGAQATGRRPLSMRVRVRVRVGDRVRVRVRDRV